MTDEESMKLNFQKISLFLSRIIAVMNNSKSEFIWVLPFLAFCIGYIFLQLFITETVIPAPNLVGKDLLQATKISSDLKLNLRIIAEKEIGDAQPGTIIKQNPLPSTSIKSHQSIFIVITKLPVPIIAPTLINKNLDQIEAICKEKGIKNRIYYLPTDLPAGQCFAQMPLSDQILESKKISCYISTGNQSQYLFPDFTNEPVENVVQFLQQQNISCDIYYKDKKIVAPYKQNLSISYQKPLAGTLIKPSNKLYVQLQVA